MGCTGWSIRDLGKEAGHEKENTLAAGNFPPFPDSGDSAWNRLGGCRTAGRFCEKNLPPGTGGLFGTDWMGRDMLKRTVAGLSLSIRLGLLTAAISAAVALALALLASLGGGLMDSLVCGLINLVMGIPHMLLLILISYSLGKGFRGVAAGIALTHWASLARLLRAEILQIRESPYVQISEKLGKKPWWIAWKPHRPAGIAAICDRVNSSLSPCDSS